MIEAPAKVSFQRENYVSVKKEIFPLLVEHWKEVAYYKDIPLDPDWLIYYKAEEVGSLRIFTVRKDKVLIGYSILFVTHNLHHKNSIQAQQDIIFIKKEHRGFGSGFIRWCDGQLKSEGVQVAIQHVSVKHDFGPMLERSGYELVDKIYCRRLD